MRRNKTKQKTKRGDILILYLHIVACGGCLLTFCDFFFFLLAAVVVFFSRKVSFNSIIIIREDEKKKKKKKSIASIGYFFDII